MTRKVFIVGCGYTGRHLAARERARGARLRALARSQASVQRLRSVGIEPIAADLDQPESLQALQVADALIYYFAPPPEHGLDDPRIEAFLDAISTGGLPERLVLISTTSVYGDCAGKWINEEQPPNPQTDRARRRLAAEQAARAWSERTVIPIVILRVAGIYGPGRLPVERLKRRLPTLLEAQSPWSNRVHVDDLVEACLAAGDRGGPGRIYNVSDGNPSTMTDYFDRVADVLGLARAPQVTMDEAKSVMSPEILSYLGESRRLDNARMRLELGVTPRYPTLSAGLAACVGEWSVE
ncbi:MAG: SDR family oxidoreductase [Acidiferrobacterales bacterium]